MKKKCNVWEINAYSGWSDYDGPSDCNIHEVIVMDVKFSKEQIIQMFMQLLTGRICVIAECKIIATHEIEI